MFMAKELYKPTLTLPKLGLILSVVPLSLIMGGFFYQTTHNQVILNI